MLPYFTVERTEIPASSLHGNVVTVWLVNDIPESCQIKCNLTVDTYRDSGIDNSVMNSFSQALYFKKKERDKQQHKTEDPANWTSVGKNDTKTF